MLEHSLRVEGGRPARIISVLVRATEGVMNER